MATNANELPYTSNPSLFLLGYLVYYDQIRELQTQFRYGNPTQAGQIAIQNAIIANVEQQFCTLKDLFVENSKCDKCQQPAMVTGSVHQNFSNAATQAIWDELVHGVNEMKNSPFEIVNDHMVFIKEKFEQLQRAYRLDNVAAAGLC